MNGEGGGKNSKAESSHPCPPFSNRHSARITSIERPATPDGGQRSPYTWSGSQPMDGRLPRASPRLPDYRHRHNCDPDPAPAARPLIRPTDVCLLRKEGVGERARYIHHPPVRSSPTEQS